MYKPIWNLIEKEISSKRVKKDIAKIWESARWSSFDRMEEIALQVKEWMKEIGLKETEVIHYPLDGKTHYNGWVIPLTWDAGDATLEIVEPKVEENKKLLAHYRDNPCSLMMYSAPTPEEGVIKEVVVIKEADKEESYRNKDVKDKIVFIDKLGIKTGKLALDKGASGIISDAIITPSLRKNRFKNTVYQWHNSTLPSWKRENTGFGFSLTPEKGDYLRSLLKDQKVKLRAKVNTRLYEGKLPLVTGLLPGKTKQEIAITGHLFEIGADDNASGCALGLEIVRTIKRLVDSGKLSPLSRGIRLIFTMEVRGLQAYIQEKKNTERIIGGINLDMAGGKEDANSFLEMRDTCPVFPSYVGPLLTHLLEKKNILKWKSTNFGTVDNIFTEAGAPIPVLIHWQTKFYHTPLDTPEHISKTTLEKIGTIAGTYVYFISQAGLKESSWLANLTCTYYKKKLVEVISSGLAGEDVQKNLSCLEQQGEEALNSIQRLVPSRLVLPSVEELRKNKDWLVKETYLFQDEELKRRINLLKQDLALFKKTQLSNFLKLSKAFGMTSFRKKAEAKVEIANEASQIIPQKEIPGFLSWEGIIEESEEELKKLGMGIGWGVPQWLLYAVLWSNGKRTLYDIWRKLEDAGIKTDPAQLIKLFQFLNKKNYLRFRPVINQGNIVSSLKKLGLKKGDVVFTHTSLSRYGYIVGGADTVIDSLIEVVGKEGTIAMPTFTSSTIGRPAYDSEVTPSRVGIISDVFWRRKGVFRSSHPTHSVAAIGKYAKFLIEGHDHHMSALDRKGPFGKLVDLDAYILMFSRIGPNTIIHAGKNWGGSPLPDLRVHFIEKGERKEATIKRCPWHTHWFPEVYKILENKGQIKEESLGEEKVYLMKAKEVVDASLTIIKKNPHIVVNKDCQCAFCGNGKSRRIVAREFVNR